MTLPTHPLANAVHLLAVCTAPKHKFGFDCKMTLTNRRGRRNLPGIARSSSSHCLEASPFFQRHCSYAHQRKLADHEADQPWKCLFHETVGMETDAEHVHAEP